MVRDEVIGEELVETLDSNAEAGRVSDECAESCGLDVEGDEEGWIFHGLGGVKAKAAHGPAAGRSPPPRRG